MKKLALLTSSLVLGLALTTTAMAHKKNHQLSCKTLKKLVPVGMQFDQHKFVAMVSKKDAEMLKKNYSHGRKPKSVQFKAVCVVGTVDWPCSVLHP